jgi:membrane protein implicated in regulation of membrane protease activity
MDEMSMTWWLWVLLGLVLMVGEVLTPGGFYIVFFGCGAVITGVAKLLGLNSLAGEGLVFVISSVALLMLFRNRLLERFKTSPKDLPLDNLAQEIAVALEEIPGGAIGKVELRGTSWTAQNLSEEPIALKRRCKVERTEGLTLFVRAI